jgi:hypothetical protein
MYGKKINALHYFFAIHLFASAFGRVTTGESSGSCSPPEETVRANPISRIREAELLTAPCTLDDIYSTGLTGEIKKPNHLLLVLIL